MSVYGGHAKSTYELFLAYINAGFTDEQAFELVKIAVREDYRRS